MSISEKDLEIVIQNKYKAAECYSNNIMDFGKYILLLGRDLVENRILTNIEYDRYGKRKEKVTPLLGINKSGIGIYWPSGVKGKTKSGRLYRMSLRKLTKIRWDDFINEI